jgi:hypothetical protein
MRLLALGLAGALASALLPAAAGAATVRVDVPPPGEVEVAVVTTPRPPAGSQRPTRVLSVANGARLGRAVAVYASPAPACSNATRRRFTVIVVVVRRRPDSGRVAGSVVLQGKGRARDVRACGSYPLRSRLRPAAVRRIRCDPLRRPRGAALLLGSSATCIGAVERRLSRRSPYQVPLNLDLGTGVVTAPPDARNVTGTATSAGEPRPGVFRYAVALLNSTPRPYAGVPSVAQDLSVDSMTFASGTSEEDPNVVGGTQELPSFACRSQLSPGLPGALTCFAPRGTRLMPRYDLEIDFDRRLEPGSNMLVNLTSPRYGDATTTYDIAVTG